MICNLPDLLLPFRRPQSSTSANRHTQRSSSKNPRSLRLISTLATALSLTMTMSASATWSIVMVNKKTKEVAIGSATCLTMFDLQKGASVVVPGLGVGAAQSYVDTTGENRLTIWLGLQRDKSPAEILQELADQDPGHETRQYGIVDTQGRAITFTGNQDGQWAGGLVGEIDDIVYAIQGNVLTGEPVILMAQDAVRNTPGGLAEKLMAGMEAARDMGGDGRCSCSPRDPEGCGSPPPDFRKSAHIGYMVVSRIGDEIGLCNRSTGCAAGDYYMNFNFAFMTNQDPDPVDLLRDAFEAWKLDMIGVPDAIQSTATFDQNELPANGDSSTTLRIKLLDLNGDPVTIPIDSVTVKNTEETKGITTIGDVVDLGDGQYAVEITSRRVEGTARFEVTVDDGVRPVTLMPPPELPIVRPTTGFVLGDPVPGLAGEENELCITGGTPGETVRVGWGFQIGFTPSACGPILLETPRFAGKAAVDADGKACISGFVPPNASTHTLHLQAVQFPSCERSNVITWQIP